MEQGNPKPNTQEPRSMIDVETREFLSKHNIKPISLGDWKPYKPILFLLKDEYRRDSSHYGYFPKNKRPNIARVENPGELIPVSADPESNIFLPGAFMFRNFGKVDYYAIDPQTGEVSCVKTSRSNTDYVVSKDNVFVMDDELFPPSMSWQADSEPDAVSTLTKLGIENVVTAFRIDTEIDAQERQITDIANIYWIKFGAPKDFPGAPSVEGKLYLPKAVDDKPKTLIHYAASFPQGNAGRFEEHYAYDFLKDGNAFFAGRNNGASLASKGDFNPKQIINSSKRLEIASRNKELYVGQRKQGGFTPVEIGNQPITSLSALAGAFEKIHLVAQSFGASSHHNAVTQLAEKHNVIVDKIDVVVSIAGFVGENKKEADGLFNGTKGPALSMLNNEIEKSGFHLRGALDDSETGLQKVAEKNSHIKIPSHIGCVLFVTPSDPILGPKDYSDESLKDYGPKIKRKIAILDLRCRDNDPRPHSMDWIGSQELLDVMKKGIPDDGPHVLTLNRGELFS